MNTLIITKAGEESKILSPANWQECSAQQALKIAFLLFENIEAGNLKYKLLQIMLGSTIKKLSIFSIKDGFALVEWIMAGELPNRNKFPEVAGLAGPNLTLTNIQFIEFIKAEKVFEKLKTDFNKETLAELAAVFYRGNPENRGDYSDENAEKRAEKLLKHELKLNKNNESFLNWFVLAYSNMRKHLIDSFPNIFKKAEDTGAKTTLVELMLDIADDPLRIEDTGKMNIYTLFYSLTLKEKKQANQ